MDKDKTGVQLNLGQPVRMISSREICFASVKR